MKLSIVGLGKLGLCTAACFAAKGHSVIGTDSNPFVVKSLQEKRTPIPETGLEELLLSAWDNLSITDDMGKAVLNSDITMVIVPTPSMSNGRFTNEYVEKALINIGKALSRKESFHVVDIVSTVMPGSSEECFVPLLEELSGRLCGRDFGLAYNPEFIALGSVIHDFLNPDLVLIGSSDKKSARMVERLYLSTCDNNPHIAHMSLINAEIAKLSLNCYVTMKISFANELASLCEKISGADVDVITGAIGHDARIGDRCIKAGLGFGGPCFPRDNIALQALADEIGIESCLGRQVVSINNKVIDRLFSLVRGGTGPGENIALLGLSYKPGTYIIEKSQPIILAKDLTAAGYKVGVWDPNALEGAREVLGATVSYHENAYDCIRDSATIVLLTDWPETHELDWNRIRGLAKKNALIIDAWRRLPGIAQTGFKYKGLGINLKKHKPPVRGQE